MVSEADSVNSVSASACHIGGPKGVSPGQKALLHGTIRHKKLCLDWCVATFSTVYLEKSWEKTLILSKKSLKAFHENSTLPQSRTNKKPEVPALNLRHNFCYEGRVVLFCFIRLTFPAAAAFLRLLE